MGINHCIHVYNHIDHTSECCCRVQGAVSAAETTNQIMSETFSAFERLESDGSNERNT